MSPSFLNNLVFMTMVVPCLVCTSQQDEKTPDRPNIHPLIRRQTILANRVEQLESKLLRLVQYELDNNPERAELLSKSLELSQSSEIVQQSREIAALLKRGTTVDIETALDNQKKLFETLNRLYSLLESSDFSKSLRNEAEKIRSQISRIDQLIQQQEGIRQRIGFSPKNTIQTEQTRLLAQTGDLEKELYKEQQPGNEGTETTDKEDPTNQEPAQLNPKNPSHKQAADNLKKAREQMDRAVQKLREEANKESARQMESAEKELGLARQKLQEELRQNREEEIENTLRGLEERFKKMLAMQLKINEASNKLLTHQKELAELRISAFQLAESQTKVILEVDKALLVLNEEGTSRAVAGTLFHLKLDMQEVVGQLETAKINNDLLKLESEVADVLAELIRSVQQEQKDQKRRQTRDSQIATGGGKVKQPLVQQLAELKIIRQLQVRINNRHKGYIEAFGSAANTQLKNEILEKTSKLATRQKQLEKMTLELTRTENQQP